MKGLAFSLIGMLVVISGWKLPLFADYSADSSPAVSTVELIRDIPYREFAAADPIKHKLDLYLPSDRHNYPLIVFVHGGGWAHGDKKFWFDLYGKLGRSFAQQGIGVAVTNYRLAPRVNSMEQTRDVSSAIAWVFRNIAQYGGNPNQIFLAGHSAGGHLVSLVSSDPRFLVAEGIDPWNIRGVISVSGVYDVKPDHPLFTMVFGSSREDRRLASPVDQIRPGSPPFLLLHGEHELPYCDHGWAKRFQDRLEAVHVASRLIPVKNRDHLSIIARLSDQHDAGHQEILRFISSQQP